MNIFLFLSLFLFFGGWGWGWGWELANLDGGSISFFKEVDYLH